MKVTPTPCLVCPSSLSIRKVVSKMNQSKVDYALLSDPNGKIAGIITESDLLKKLDWIIDQGQYDQPIALIMNSPVKTLPLHLYHTAPEFFRTHHVNHAPVTNFNTQKNRDEVVGIITAEAVMEAMVDARKLPHLYSLGNNKIKRRTLGVASPNGLLFHLIDKVYADTDKVDVERLMFANLQTPQQLIQACSKLDGIILDLEEAPERYWKPTLEFMVDHKDLQFLAIVMNQTDHQGLIDYFKELQSQKVLQIYYKPLNLHRLTMALERFWAE